MPKLTSDSDSAYATLNSTYFLVTEGNFRSFYSTEPCSDRSSSSVRAENTDSKLPDYEKYTERVFGHIEFENEARFGLEP